MKLKILSSACTIFGGGSKNLGKVTVRGGPLTVKNLKFSGKIGVGPKYWVSVTEICCSKRQKCGIFRKIGGGSQNLGCDTVRGGPLTVKIKGGGGVFDPFRQLGAFRVMDV